MEPYTDEEIPYLMGQYQRKKALVKTAELAELGRVRGLLVVPDDRGEAWDLVDRFWNSQIPAARRWKLRGHAWLHWLGLGEPDNIAMVVVANPKRLGELVFTDALVMLEEAKDEEKQEVVRKLHVVPISTPVVAIDESGKA